MNDEDGGPAFPVIPPIDETGCSVSGYPYPTYGMTLRDYFAAKIAAACWSNSELLKRLDAGSEGQHIAQIAFEQADEMLKAREA